MPAAALLVHTGLLRDNSDAAAVESSVGTARLILLRNKRASKI